MTNRAYPDQVERAILRKILKGSKYAAAILPWKQFGPILLPDDTAELDHLIHAHVCGTGASVQFAPIGKPAKCVRVDSLILGAYCPDAEGRCVWTGIDLDGSTHGKGSLVDPDRGAAAIAERADSFGLLSGVLIVKSRSGSGRHVWIFPPEPIPQDECCIAIAFLAAMAWRIAARDVEDYGCSHAFMTRAGTIAAVGQAGAVELIPKSTERPDRGYVLALPFGAVAALCGGGVTVNVFEHPSRIIESPKAKNCDAVAWARFMADASATLRRLQPPVRRREPCRHPRLSHRLDPRTEQVLSGAVPEGERNKAVYYGLRDLIRSGIPASEAERMLIAGGIGAVYRDGKLRRRSEVRKGNGVYDHANGKGNCRNILQGRSQAHGQDLG